MSWRRRRPGRWRQATSWRSTGWARMATCCWDSPTRRACTAISSSPPRWPGSRHPRHREADMARIVAAMAMVHGPRITATPELPGPEVAQRVWDGFAALRRELEAASPDWALVITNEHLTNPFFPYVAPLTLGTAPKFRAPAERSAA